MLYDFATGFDVNREHPLQALRPGHVHPMLGRRSITVRGASVKHTISGMAVLRCICRSDILIESLQGFVSGCLGNSYLESV